jgi:ABC-2 type transport system ATP-binding protein
MQKSELCIKNLVVAYEKKPVIRDVSLDFESGTFVGLIGPNGAGKTTFMLAISGQFQPQSGFITFAGQDIYEQNYLYKKQIGYVHETPFFYEHLTVEEFLVFVARLKGMPRADIAKKLESLLDAVRLTEEKEKLT